MYSNVYDNAFKYVDENVLDYKVKCIFKNVYDKYGPLYMLNLLTSKKKSSDFKQESYYPALLRDFEQTMPELDVLTIIDTIPLGRFSSFVYYLETENDYVGYNSFYIIGASHRIEMNRQYIFFDGVSKVSKSFIMPKKSIQVNIGWSLENELLIEWFIDGEFTDFINLSVLCGKEAVFEFSNQAEYRMGFVAGNFIKFSIPNSKLVSDNFILNFN